MSEDVRVNFQVGGKNYVMNFPKGSTINGKDLKDGITIKFSKEQFTALNKIAGLDKNSKNFTQEDCKNFDKLSKADQTNLINSALKSTGSNYKVGDAINIEGTEDIVSRWHGVTVNMTPKGQMLPENDPKVKYININID